MIISEILRRAESGEMIPVVVLAAVEKLLCPVSVQTMRTFNEGWKFGRSYEEYQVAARGQLMGCLRMEASEIGAIVRSKFDLPTLTLQSEVSEQ